MRSALVTRVTARKVCLDDGSEWSASTNLEWGVERNGRYIALWTKAHEELCKLDMAQDHLQVNLARLCAAVKSIASSTKVHSDVLSSISNNIRAVVADIDRATGETK